MDPTSHARSIPARVARLLLGQAVLGLGIGLLLACQLGSDGYSTAVHGLSAGFGIPYVAINIALATAFIALAWIRGIRPGLGTATQPIVVGAAATYVLSLSVEPTAILWRVAVFVPSLLMVAVGVAIYLSAQLGSGPVEAAALAWTDVLGFRLSYCIVQVAGAFAGWIAGAAVGAGTVATALAIGPLVTALGRASSLFRP